MTKIISSFALVLSAFSSKDKEPLNIIDVLSSPKSVMTDLSEMAVDIEYIPLETTENSLIKELII
jgi:hypothetical protein